MRRPSRRRFAVASAGALLAFVAGCASVAVAPRVDDGPTAARTDLEEEFAGLIRAHNREREKEDLPPLTENEALTRAARTHAADMAKREKLSHTGSDGSSPFDRMKKEGYRFQRAAENAAYGQRTLKDVMKSWMNSPGHRANILGKYTEIGAAYATAEDGTPYWCVTFGKPFDE